MAKEPKERAELASNAEWILFRETDGSLTAEPRNGGAKQKLSQESLKKLKSLMGLVEGREVEVE